MFRASGWISTIIGSPGSDCFLWCDIKRFFGSRVMFDRVQYSFQLVHTHCHHHQKRPWKSWNAHWRPGYSLLNGRAGVYVFTKKTNGALCTQFFYTYIDTNELLPLLKKPPPCLKFFKQCKHRTIGHCPKSKSPAIPPPSHVPQNRKHQIFCTTPWSVSRFTDKM